MYENFLKNYWKSDETSHLEKKITLFKNTFSSKSKIIVEEEYHRRKVRTYNENDFATPALAFKEFIEDEFNYRINNIPHQGFEEQGEQKIANVSLAFRNSDVINALKRRGEYIKSNNLSKVRVAEKEIDKIFKTRERLDRVNRPCWVFITFVTEEGKERAMAYFEELEKNSNIQEELKEEFKLFMGEEFTIDEANEPSDIQWENRQFDESYRTW